MSTLARGFSDRHTLLNVCYVCDMLVTWVQPPQDHVNVLEVHLVLQGVQQRQTTPTERCEWDAPVPGATSS